MTLSLCVYSYLKKVNITAHKLLCTYMYYLPIIFLDKMKTFYCLQNLIKSLLFYLKKK